MNRLEHGRTAGRRALLVVLQRTRGAFVAARCRVTSAQVSRWASGHTRPSAAARALLWSSYGIPTDDWERPALSPPRRRSP